MVSNDTMIEKVLVTMDTVILLDKQPIPNTFPTDKTLPFVHWELINTCSVAEPTTITL
jgi:hypothetical protein